MGPRVLRQEVLPPRKAPCATDISLDGSSTEEHLEQLRSSMIRVIFVSMGLIGTAQVIMQFLGMH